MKKRLFSIALCAALVFAMAVPAFATPIDKNNANSQWIYAWQGSGRASLTYRGVANTITVNKANTGVNRNAWSIVPAPHGQYRITYNGADVNIYRVLQHGIYYLCTAYPYEENANGVDQRVDVITLNNYTQFRLATALNGERWYLMPDRSAESSSSDVIWYTTAGQYRAYWSA